ncbi:hypothetical protein C0995_009790, partial [Termitomyces sp. Mi166
MFKTGDAQLTASFSLKARPALTIEGVIVEDCSEPTNPEPIYQPILVDLEKEKSVSTYRLMPTYLPLKQNWKIRFSTKSFPKYHKYANLFSEESTKELPPT